MKRYIALFLSACAAFVMATSSALAAGLLTPADGSLPDLKIQSQHVKVVVNDGFATTTVDQVFTNPNPQDLEAVYSFPLPQQAAVGEFSYWIDGTEIIGEVVAKDKAREIYQEQKNAGQEAALAEQDSYRRFDMKVYPVRAGSSVKIRLVYLQKINLDTGMGRYVYPLEEGGTDDPAAASFWQRRDTVEQDFSFELVLRSGYPVDGLRLPAHPTATVSQTNQGEWVAKISQQATGAAVGDDGQPLATSQPAAKLDKDIVVYWRQQEGLPGSLDLFSYRAADASRGTFMAVLTPAEDLQPLNQGRDWVFVLDISGSMQGKYRTLVDGVRQGMGKLRQSDRFRVILFNNAARELTNGFTHVTPNSVTGILKTLENTQPGGGTNLYAGLEDGIDDLDSDRPAAIILVTDGVANIGKTETKHFRKLMKKRDVRLFSFVMGNGANHPLLMELSKLSNGFAASVSNSDDIVGQILLATSKLTHASFRDVKVRLKGVKTSDVTPEEFGTVYRGQQLIVFGHYWGDGKAELTMTGSVNGEKKKYTTQVQLPKVAEQYPEIERLWAFARIGHLIQEQALLGENADAKQAIQDMAIEYGLVTESTSMIVLREDLFKKYGIERRNKQRVTTERNARDQRHSQPVQSQQADTSQPMFRKSRPSLGGGGGGGSAGLPIIALLLLAAAIRKASGRRKH